MCQGVAKLITFFINHKKGRNAQCIKCKLFISLLFAVRAIYVMPCSTRKHKICCELRGEESRGEGRGKCMLFRLGSV